MGCISSKAITRSMSIREAITRSMSIREETNNDGLKNTSSITWEELLTSHSGNDQLFAFLYSPKKTNSFTLPSQDPETTSPGTKYLANAWDLIQEIDKKIVAESSPVDVGRLRRSMSCKIQSDLRPLSPGSRSFHTVEEYDALLDRINKSGTSNADQYSSPIKQVGLNTEPGNKEDVGIEAKGWKRKGVAKRLASLELSSIEFPAVARFRQRNNVDGQVYSPGNYVTPKFGSYNANKVKGKENVESCVFSAGLVDEFEESMKQIQEEEDSILSHMDEYFVEIVKD